MGELVAWGLGLSLGYSVRNKLTARRPILLFLIAVAVVGGLITLASGEMASEPWPVLIDIGQVAVAAVIGAFAVPFVVRGLVAGARSTR
jgi:membrane protein YqaA with SNARE-associated domain